MLAIESGLSGMVEADVVRINPYLPKTLDRIKVLEPRVVIIERTWKNNELTLEILDQSIPVIVLDEARRSFMVLTKEDVPKAEISELTHVIERINRQRDPLSHETLTETVSGRNVSDESNNNRKENRKC
jgi:hypothetical protein